MSFNINVEVKPDEAHQALLDAIEEADLSWTDAQAARNAMNAALAFLNDVGDPSVDPGVSITITGDAGSSLETSVIQMEADPAPEPLNVPHDEPVEAVEEDVLGYAIAGQHANPDTGDAFVDNTPGAGEDVELVESVAEPQDVLDPAADLSAPMYHSSEEALAAVGDTEGVVVDLEGSPKDILESVGDDPDKARAALEVEQASDKPRKRLVADLEKVIGE